jgi:hypothetical protein
VRYFNLQIAISLSARDGSEKVGDDHSLIGIR